MPGFLRVDGREMPLTDGRLLYRRATCAGRGGHAVWIAAYGGRHLLHLATWLPGTAIADITGQTAAAGGSPDAAVDGRLITRAELRFGFVHQARVVISIDGEAEPLDFPQESRARIEADVSCAIEEPTARRFCVGCGADLISLSRPIDEYVGGLRVRYDATPATCGDCGPTPHPRFCPICGDVFDAREVETLSDEFALAYTATCPRGHVSSARLRGA